MRTRSNVSERPFNQLADKTPENEYRTLTGSKDHDSIRLRFDLWTLDMPSNFFAEIAEVGEGSNEVEWRLVAAFQLKWVEI